MKIFNLILVIALLSLFGSCNKDADYETATLEHMGFDFSDNASSSENDGEVISWYPGGGSNPTYPTGIWWRADQGGLNNEQQHLGEVDMEDISSIPSTWDATLTPLLANHVYIVKCRDGYALFKVNSIDEANMEANVDFVFSTSGAF